MSSDDEAMKNVVEFLKAVERSLWLPVQRWDEHKEEILYRVANSKGINANELIRWTRHKHVQIPVCQGAFFFLKKIESKIVPYF